MRCEVRRDRCARQGIRAVRYVRGPEGQAERLSGLEMRRHRGPSAAERQPDAGADRCHPCGTQRRPRQSADGAAMAGSRLPGQQGTGGAADARPWHSCPPRVALQGDNGLETRPASGGNPAGSQLHAECAESSVGVGHHVFVDERRLALPGHRSRLVQPRGRRLVLEAAHDGGHRPGCADHGLVQEAAGTGAAASFRPGQPSMPATPSRTSSRNTA